MSNQLTIRDALQELRQLSNVVFSNVEEDLKRAQERAAAAHQMTNTLNSITTQLGFSVALDALATKPKDEPVAGSSRFSGPTVTKINRESPKSRATSQRRSRRRKPLFGKELAERTAKIIALRGQGYSHGQIAEELDIAHTTVWKALSKLPADPLGAPTAEQTEEVRSDLEFADHDPKFRFELKSPLSETELAVMKLMRKSWPGFTTAEDMAARGAISHADVAGPTVTRLRAKGVPVESAKQARDHGEDVGDKEAGWRFIAKD